MSVMSNILAFPARPVGSALRRPAVLVRAAVAGQALWRRERDLRRVLHCESLPAPGQALARLREEEDRLNLARLEDAADYDMQHQGGMVSASLADSGLAPARAGAPRLRALG